MAEPAYSFTLPSLEDDTKLECRIHHPKDLSKRLSKNHESVKGAVLAHPYAPFGGCYDDFVVLSVKEILLEQSYVVATFNFRGAGGSQGRTSWTGRGETEDYISVAGFLVYYLHALQHLALGSEALRTIPSDDNGGSAAPSQAQRPILLLLGGYSYGSLILAKLPSFSALIVRFEAVTLGTSGAEIVLRARMLAKQTIRTAREAQTPTRPRGRSLDAEVAASSPLMRPRASTVTMGGEEIDPSQRRSSRESRRSVDAVVRKAAEVPQRIKAHIRHHSDQSRRGSPLQKQVPQEPRLATSNAATVGGAAPEVKVSYLLISPVVVPFTTTLMPPGPPSLALTARKGAANSSADALFSKRPTLAIFGTTDSFTSSRRLVAWAEKQARMSSTSRFEWEQIEAAGHFWREEGVMQALQRCIKLWVNREA